MANKAFTNANGRQWPLVALVDFDFTNFTDTAVAVPVVKLPPNAVVIAGYIDVIVAFDSTTATMNIGDVTSATRYGSAVALKTVAKTALTLTDYAAGSLDDIIFTPTITGTATVGSGRIMVEYVVKDRATEVQTN